MKFKGNRRLFLKGAGGAALSLPILEVMLNASGTAYADDSQIAGNFIFTSQGESSGHPRKDSILFKPTAYGNLKDAFNRDPNNVGCYGVKAFADKGMLDDVNIISNLQINQNNRGTPGNVSMKFSGGSIHNCANYVVRSGFGVDNGKNWWTESEKRGKHSCDQIVYDKFGRQGKHLIVAAEKKEDGWAQSTSIRDGRIVKAERSLSRTFDLLFSNFTPPKVGAPPKDEKLSRRQSILDLILVDHNRLNKKIGYQDRLEVDKHLQLVRDLEKDIAKIEIADQQLACDISKGFSNNVPYDTSYNYATGYEGLMERAYVWNRLIALAVSCGQSRVISYTILRHKAMISSAVFMKNLSATERNKLNSDERINNLHGVYHWGLNEALDVARNVTYWVTDVYSDLMKRLKDVPVGDKNLLDYTFMTMAMLEGYGRRIDGAVGDNGYAVHSFENMCHIHSGGKAFGAKTGRHIDGQKRHPIAVENRAVELLGINNLTFGEIKDKVNIG